MATRWLRTDEFKDAVDALEMLAESLARCSENRYRWKWALVALQSAVQGFMVLALAKEGELPVLGDKDAERWREWYEAGSPPSDEPPEPRLNRFEELYAKVKQDRAQKWPERKAFRPQGTQDRNITDLPRRFRNAFVHFQPGAWSIELAQFPPIILDCIGLIEFLGWQCGSVRWDVKRDEKRARKAIRSARASAEQLHREYSGPEGG